MDSALDRALDKAPSSFTLRSSYSDALVELAHQKSQFLFVLQTVMLNILIRLDHSFQFLRFLQILLIKLLIVVLSDQMVISVDIAHTARDTLFATVLLILKRAHHLLIVEIGRHSHIGCILAVGRVIGNEGV